MTPGTAIRKHCVECVGSPYEIENCRGDFLYATEKKCPFYRYRMGKGRPSVKLIRKYCMFCMSGSYQAINQCNSEICVLTPFRFGTNPNYQLSDIERKKRVMRLNNFPKNEGLS